MRKLLFRLGALLWAAAGAALCWFGAWLLGAEIIPQILSSGWSLSGDNVILNRNWQGNQLYLLVFLYLAFGLSLLVGSLRLWRRGRALPPSAS